MINFRENALAIARASCNAGLGSNKAPPTDAEIESVAQAFENDLRQTVADLHQILPLTSGVLLFNAKEMEVDLLARAFMFRLTPEVSCWWDNDDYAREFVFCHEHEGKMAFYYMPLHDENIVNHLKWVLTQG